MSDLSATPYPAPPPSRFFAAYTAGGSAPWDTGAPQPAFVALADAGHIGGTVLDVGCGTGENALYLAARGHEVWGVDFVEAAIAAAREKAALRGVAATFEVADALALQKLARTFDTVIDSGCFHVFPDEARPRYASGLAAVVRPGGLFHLLCFSEHEDRPGPRRVTQDDIRATFADAFREVSVEPTRFESLAHEGGARAWIATLERLA